MAESGKTKALETTLATLKKRFGDGAIMKMGEATGMKVEAIPTGSISLDLALLRRFPEGYRHLAYLQTKNGAKVDPNLPTARGEALEKLLREAKVWLAAAL